MAIVVAAVTVDAKGKAEGRRHCTKFSAKPTLVQSG